MDCCCCFSIFRSCFDYECEDFFLQDCNSDNTPEFEPHISRGKVISVYDGDTLTLAARINKHGKPFAFKIRLAGIDSAELKGASGAQLACAQAAKQMLSDRVLGKCVTLTNLGKDKYGRVLARVWCNGVCVNDWMLEQGIVVPYAGKKKAEVNWAEIQRHAKGIGRTHVLDQD
eukprot:c9708_g1_i1.p2 GENE.c9708_g1_i1~~c9708_g1_i1.p2  ORF type:complete len:173 (-),score=28.96 c9708_g1_i1:950-1468(-)